ncbi:nucleotide-diphospho-sugar transferase [Irpex rosettiformis]|uniref:Nucleotide-diphospho-sugar transferase n=1 Tax=Irpex rosettiformis TaxID=378272 RepID=A0ACB8UK15_9APHY|nr:nucleotide-diphospho-sugar transferase [Irpex rosettiformis]
MKAAYVTLLTKNSYLPGVLVLHQSLLDVSAKYPLVVMATAGLPADGKEVLTKRGIDIVDVESLSPEEGRHTLSSTDVRFTDTWTKLRSRVVLIDSDMIIRRNMDELMDLELPSDWIAAAHACACNPRKLSHYPKDWIPANCAYTAVSHPEGLTSPTQITADSPRTYGLLNSGTVVINPSTELAESIHNYLATSPLIPTFSFPDQDLLANFFAGRWKALPWCYNALKTLRQIHQNLWRDEEIRCVHYILHQKPWHAPRGSVPEDEVTYGWWWADYDRLRDAMKESDPEGWELVDSHVAKA